MRTAVRPIAIATAILLSSSFATAAQAAVLLPSWNVGKAPGKALKKSN
jgi:hypothetical protein